MGDNEVYCHSCGKLIKAEAEICPHCGVRQIQNIHQHPEVSDIRIYKLQELAGKNIGIAIILSLLIPLLGYIYVEKWGFAVINFLTLNYFFFGIIIVPVHIYSIISDARNELNAIGANY